MTWVVDGQTWYLKGTPWSLFFDRVQCWVYYKYYNSQYSMLQGTFETFEDACEYIETVGVR